MLQINNYNIGCILYHSELKMLIKFSWLVNHLKEKLFGNFLIFMIENLGFPKVLFREHGELNTSVDKLKADQLFQEYSSKWTEKQQ